MLGDNMLIKSIIAIVIGILIFYGTKYILWPLIKLIGRYLVCLLKWLIITIPVWFIILFLPISIKPIYVLFVIAGIAGIDFYLRGKKTNKDTYVENRHTYTNYSSSEEHYVLNTKSRVAHKSWDVSANTIKSDNRKDVHATKEQLFEKGYRMKQNK